MQNQVDYYRSRGYFTVFVCVPIHCSYVADHPDWPELKAGMNELGADRIYFATIDNWKFTTAKYTAWVRQSFRGTALDWIILTAKSAQLPPEALAFLRSADVSLIHVNHVFTLGFARYLQNKVVRSGRQLPLIIDTHDIQASALEDRHEINPWTHRYDSLERLERSEIAHLKSADVMVHLSVDDLRFFQERFPQKAHVLAMPTIDQAFVSMVERTEPRADDPIDILFVGQSTTPNTAAIQWFFEKVWPLIADRGYRLKVVGGISTAIREKLPAIYAAFASYFVGPTATADLAPFYASARCVIAPMISGTGVSIKTIEALALGKPFVGTSKAYRGMPTGRLESAGLRAYDTPESFADAIVQALHDGQAAAAASRSAYAALFSQQAAFAARDNALQAAVIR